MFCHIMPDSLGAGIGDVNRCWGWHAACDRPMQWWVSHFAKLSQGNIPLIALVASIGLLLEM